jgi:hypothetical protein
MISTAITIDKPINFARTYHEPRSHHTHEVYCDMPGLLVTKSRQVLDGETDQPVAHFLTEGDLIAVPFQSMNHGVLYRQYRASSAVGYALRYNECPIKAVDQARANRDDLHYLVPVGVTLSSDKRERPVAYRVLTGELVKFHGRFFKTVPAGNNNLKLVEVQ